MRNFRIATLLLTVLLIMAGVVSADEQNKKTVFTFKDSVQVPGQTLPAGTYVFKLANSDSNRHIVQIYSQDETKLITTILAVPNYQLTPSGETIITYAKAPANQPMALEAWFYPGDNFGQQFVYPQGVATELSTLNTIKVPSTGSEQAYPNSTSDTSASTSSTSTTTTPSTSAPATATPSTTDNNNMSSGTSATATTSTPSSASSATTSTPSAATNSATTSTSSSTSSTTADNMSSAKPRTDDTTAANTTANTTTSATATAAEPNPAASSTMSNSATDQDRNRTMSGTSATSQSANSQTSSEMNSQSNTTDRSQNLPQTASTLPLAGLIGFLSIGAAVVLRKLVGHTL